METLTIDKEFQSLCPALTPEERNLLEASIEKDGCRESIVVWANHDDTVLDGHNRYEICQHLDKQFKTKALNLPDRAACIEWIITNQLGRRNLSDEQKSYLRGKRYQAEKKAPHRPSAEEKGGHSAPLKTADKLAAEFNVDAKTIKRDEKFAAAVDKVEKVNGKEAKDKILSGKSGLSKKEVVEIAELPATEQKQAIETKSVKPSASPVRSEYELLIERIEKLIDSVNRMAADRMGHNAKSKALLQTLQTAIKDVKAMQKSWRN